MSPETAGIIPTVRLSSAMFIFFHIQTEVHLDPHLICPLLMWKACSYCVFTSSTLDKNKFQNKQSAQG